MTGSVSPISLCATPQCRMPSTQSWPLAATLSWPKSTYATHSASVPYVQRITISWECAGRASSSSTGCFPLASALHRAFSTPSQSWLAKQSSTVHIHHYLDDFFLAGEPGSEQCAHQLHSLTTLCTNLGVPLAEDKMEGPSTTLEYLGITLDSANLEARLSPEKLQDIHTSLDQWSGRQHCAKSELLSLIGTLSFAAKVVPAGRTFLRRMIDLSMTVHSLQGDISLTPEFRSDLAWWRAFARPWSGRSFFLSPQWTPAPDLHLYTDSSGSLGFGAYCHGRWFMGEWDEEQMAHSIQWKELYPIVMAAMVWGSEWSTLRILLWCDNQAVVQCITSGTSHCPHLMHLLRNLMLLAASNNFLISAKHIPGVQNAIADSLSRFRMQDFRELAPSASDLPTPIPTSLPLLRI